MNPGARPEYFTSPKPLPIATHIEGWLFKHVVPFEVGTATVLESGGEPRAPRPPGHPAHPPPLPPPQTFYLPSPRSVRLGQLIVSSLFTPPPLPPPPSLAGQCTP